MRTSTSSMSERFSAASRLGSRSSGVRFGSVTSSASATRDNPSCSPRTRRYGRSPSPEHTGEKESRNGREADRGARALADELARVVAEVLDALVVELGGGLLQAAR